MPEREETIALTLATTDPVKLRYRINRDQGAGGAWTDVAMTARLQGDYHYAIPSSIFQIGDVIDFYIRAEVTDTTKQFTCFPTQAQFDWTANPPAEERDFFSVLVTDSAKVTALSTDLRTDPNWTLMQGEWEFGSPTLEELSEQPGNDYPFDNNVGAGSGPTLPNCYFTSTTDSVSPPPEPWRLTTESFDLTGLDQVNDNVVVSYALWFYVRQGNTSDAFTVEIGDGTNWVEIDRVAADASGTALQRWIRRRVTVDDTGQHTTGRRLRFSAHHLLGTGTVEAVMDEVRVWGVIND